MDLAPARSGLARARSFPQYERESGFLSGLVDLTRNLGYVVPSLSFVRQDRSLRPDVSHSRQISESLSEHSRTESSLQTQGSTEALLQAEQSEPSTSGRDDQDTTEEAETPAAAAERHRMGSASNFDLQVKSLEYRFSP